MLFYWDGKGGLTRDEWTKVQNWSDGELANGDFMGNVRVGDLCFDLSVYGMDYGEDVPTLSFDLFVGGIDDGYGYADGGYPYTYYDGGSLGDMENFLGYNYKEFKVVVETMLSDYIKESGCNIIKKANENLHVW